MFETDEIDTELLAKGIAPNKSPIREKWTKYVSQILNEAPVVMPSDPFMQTGSSKGIHTAHLGHVLSEMQYLQLAYPDAEW